MTLKEYVAKLNKFLADNPKAAEFDVIYARDDEGNGYQKVYYDPTSGEFDAESGDFSIEDSTHNSVCIN